MSLVVDKDEDMIRRMLTQFYSDLDADVKKRFLNKVRDVTEHRLELVDELLEETR
jgi:hypothetical protein